MKWYKHFTDWHTDSDINEGIRIYGMNAYSVHCILREIYGFYYNKLDDEGFLEIELQEIAKKCHINQKKVEEILDFFQEKSRIIYERKGKYIKVKVPEFIRLAGAWRIRTQDQNVTPNREASARLKEEEEIRRKEDKIIDQEFMLESDSREILQKLNKTYNKKFWSIDFIKERLREEGRDKEKFFKIIETKKNDNFFIENKRLYNPHTLFKKEYFEKYLNEAEIVDDKYNNENNNKKFIETEEMRKQYFEYMKNELAELQVELWCIISKYDIDDLIEELKLGEFLNDILCVKLDEKEIIYFSINAKPQIYRIIFEEIKEKTNINYEYQYLVPEEFYKIIEADK